MLYVFLESIRKKQGYHQYIQEQKNIYQKYYPSFVGISEEHFFSPNGITFHSYNPQGHDTLSMVYYLLLVLLAKIHFYNLVEKSIYILE